MRRRTAIAAAALPLLLTAVACGTAQKTATGASPAATPAGSAAASGSAPAPSAAASLTGPLGDAKNIKVDGSAGTMPKVTFPAGNPALTSSARVIAPGDGSAAKDGDTLVANVSVYTWDGKENKTVGSAYDKGTPEFVPVNQNLPKVLHDGLVGLKPGGRVLVVIAKDSLDQAMIDNAKQQGTDFGVTSQVLVIDMVSAAARAAVGNATDPGIEGVKLVNPGGETAPELTTKTVAQPPKDLVVKTVIKGDGPKVKETQTVMVHYTGKIWGSDQEFDSSWKRGEATQFALSQVVKGWAQGLTGVAVGSRVVITIPPELGYGKEGQAEAGIKGTDTLVFVVDVLGAV
ncbi:FKBP-type peptidyl-prolyl cis-trans isomerase [Acrocarpospora macrocephala]|uniref:peptidylprolyl isomerase n=1 Tax=Acrocarpospora macrocephala TaxID=150177 RepID=A0A5M3WME8_9ACTN|nr:FKBP-type peptidyl-prolyl cis-trans isomerase [Acrocarpospora macrocephala]GES09680.1 peptidylprolyl isomerase [Acrocarpospora macrocephala]